MNMQDGQDEVGAILARIAMIAEEVNVIALEGSGGVRTCAHQMVINAEVQLRLREMLALCDAADVSRKHGSEPVPPEAHRLVANVDFALEQQVLNVPQ